MKKVLILLLLVIAASFAANNRAQKVFQNDNLMNTITQPYTNNSVVKKSPLTVVKPNYNPSTMPLIGSVMTVGWTGWDWPWNGPVPSICRIDPATGGVHTYWMSADAAGTNASRNQGYNYYDIATGALNWPTGSNVYPMSCRYGGFDYDPISGAGVGSTYATMTGYGIVLARDAGAGQGLWSYDTADFSYLWPYNGVTNNGAIHVIATDAISTVTCPLVYIRSNPWGTMTTPVSFTDSLPYFPDYNIAASKKSNKVCITWVMANDPVQSRAFYKISSDGGSTWGTETELPFPSTGLTSPSFWVTGVFGMYDTADNLHFVAAVQEAGYIAPVEIWHWSEANSPNWNMIYHYAPASWTATYSPATGSNNLASDRPTLAQDATTGYFYCSWEQFDTLNYEPTTGIARADIFLAESRNNGATWPRYAKITDPDMTSKRFPCVGGCYDDTVYVEYLVDSISGAGKGPTVQGAVTYNPVVLHKVARTDLPVMVLENDVAVTGISIDGTRPMFPGEVHNITVTLTNWGTLPQTAFDVAFDPSDGSGVITESWSGSLGSMSSVPYTFTGTWTTGATGTFNFKAYTTMTGDERPANDTSMIVVPVCPLSHTPPYTKDFDEDWGAYGDNPPFCGWTITSNATTPPWNATNWFHAALLTPHENVAAVSYDAGGRDQDEWLISPKFSCTWPGTYSLNFWHEFSAWYSTYDTCIVLISNDNGLNWTELQRWSSDGTVYAIIDSGYKTYDITAIALGSAEVKVAFRYKANYGDYWAVDDFTLGYIPTEYSLTINIVGAGSVDRDPELLTYPYGSTVTLTAIPDPGYAFVEWTGNLTGTTNPADVYIDGDKNITATFELAGTPGWSPSDNVPPAPDLKVGKFVKDGGSMVTVGGTDAGDAVYMFPGNKSWHFYKYEAGVYTTLESIPYGVKVTDPLKINKKKIGKGAALCYDGLNTIYATKGNGTTELWAYDILTNTWTQKAFVPVPKALKGGTSLVYYGGKLYLLAGGQKKTDLNNFFVYDIATDAWTPDSSLTLGPNTKVWKDGACLAVLNETIYALKTNDKENFFYGRGVLDPHWGIMLPIPYAESLFGKWKKALLTKDGAAMAVGGGAIYAIKGGGANVFWKFDGVAWSKMESIPRLDKKSVPKTGASLTYADGKVWLIKGNNRQELWQYLDIAKAAGVNPTLIQTVTANPTPLSSFNFSASMLSKTLRYTVPVSGKVSIKLYNATGRLVETVHNGYLNAGTYTTNLSNIASGVYFLKYEDRTNRAEIKLIVE
jgi:hypothetical protein